MPTTKQTRSRTTKASGRSPKASGRSSATRRRKPATTAASRRRGGVGRAADLSEDVLQTVEDGQRAAIDAVQKFVDTVDRSLPRSGAGASKRQDVIDSALEMADRLVHTQYDFIRKVVHSAGESLGDARRAK